MLLGRSSTDPAWGVEAMTTTVTGWRWPGFWGVLSAPLVWVERTRGWRRWGLLLTYGLIVVVLACYVWRWTVLRDLPDVGDPFDVAAFSRALEVPDEQNAFVAYREAARQVDFTSRPLYFGDIYDAAQAPWAKISPAMRLRLDENRPALETWRIATERPDAVWEPVERLSPIVSDPWSRANEFQFLSYLALMEAAHCEDAGDMAGAWGWYRALLRCQAHCERHGTFRQRDTRWFPLGVIVRRVGAWADDPRVEAPLLRRALKEAQTIDASIPPLSDAYKVEYVAAMRQLDDPDLLLRHVAAQNSTFVNDASTQRNRHVVWFFQNEPERTRRILRLIYANRLAYADSPPAARPKLYVPPGYAPPSGIAASQPDFALYRADPSAPPAARALPPERIYAWIQTTELMVPLMPLFGTYETQLAEQRLLRETLLLNLAEGLYTREHGRSPASYKDLVGPGYLDRLPDDEPAVIVETPDP